MTDPKPEEKGPLRVDRQAFAVLLTNWLNREQQAISQVAANVELTVKDTRGKEMMIGRMQNGADIRSTGPNEIKNYRAVAKHCDIELPYTAELLPSPKKPDRSARDDKGSGGQTR